MVNIKRPAKIFGCARGKIENETTRNRKKSLVLKVSPFW